MALDAELLDRFERDWNDAMANYEARTTASRMGNVQYDPASRTFAPQEVDPGVASGIQSELFGPLQAKWGILSGGAGRGRASAAAQPQEPRLFQTRAGVFSVDPRTGKSTKIIDVPPSSSGVTSTPESRRDLAVFQSALRRLENARRAMTSAATKREAEAATKEVAAAEAAFAALQQPAKASGFAVDPESIPYGSPVTRVPPAPATMRGFIGAPGGANAFIPNPFSTNQPQSQVQAQSTPQAQGVEYVPVEFSDAPALPPESTEHIPVEFSPFVETGGGFMGTPGGENAFRGAPPSGMSGFIGTPGGVNDFIPHPFGEPAAALPPEEPSPTQRGVPFQILGPDGQWVNGLDFSDQALPVGPSASRGVKVLQIRRK